MLLGDFGVDGREGLRDEESSNDEDEGADNCGSYDLTVEGGLHYEVSFVRGYDDDGIVGGHSFLLY